MGAYLKWLLESRLGPEEASRGNNQETWEELQITALAPYNGQTQVALATLERSRAAIGREFEPDGRQPRELARTRALDYSIFNLTAFLNLAALGDGVGVDLWNYCTANGRSLRKGVGFPGAVRDRREALPVHADHPVSPIRSTFCPSAGGSGLERPEVPGPRATSRRGHGKAGIDLTLIYNIRAQRAVNGG
jgi:alginate lyase